MPDFTDLKITTDWDLVLSDSGDLELALPALADVQDIYTRVMTNYHEYPLEPLFGCNLQEYFGRPMSLRNIDLVKGSVRIGLGGGGRFLDKPIRIDAIPLSKHDLGLILTMQRDTGTASGTVVPFTINFEEATIEPINV